MGIKNNFQGDRKTKSSSDSSKADKQSFVMVNLSPDKMDVTETEVNGNIGNSIGEFPVACHKTLSTDFIKVCLHHGLLNWWCL